MSRPVFVFSPTDLALLLVSVSTVAVVSTALACYAVWTTGRLCPRIDNSTPVKVVRAVLTTAEAPR